LTPPGVSGILMPHTVTTEQQTGKNMRTKTLLIAAAALAVSAGISMAQTYSQNIVGYVNLTVVNGYHMYANPLDLDGTGVNNTVLTTLGTNTLPVGSQVLTWNGASFVVNSFSIPVHKTVPVWSSPNAPLNPGAGIFINNNGPATNIMIVGTALIGTQVNPNLPAGGGFYCVGSVVPVGGDITTNLQYNPALHDQVLVWDDGIQSYDVYTYSIPVHKTLPVWSPSNPQVAVGQGFFINTTNTAANWTEIVNP